MWPAKKSGGPPAWEECELPLWGPDGGKPSDTAPEGVRTLVRGAVGILFVASVLDEKGAGREERVSGEGRGAAPVRGDGGRAPKRLLFGMVDMAAEALLVGYRVL